MIRLFTLLTLVRPLPPVSLFLVALCEDKIFKGSRKRRGRNIKDTRKVFFALALSSSLPLTFLSVPFLLFLNSGPLSKDVGSLRVWAFSKTFCSAISASMLLQSPVDNEFVVTN